MLSRRVIKFLIAGAVAAALNFGSRFIFSEFMPFEYAIVCAFGVGLLSGFLLNKLVVFGPTDNALPSQISAYIGVNLFALLQTWLVTVLLAALLVPRIGSGAGEAIAHFFGVAVPAVSSYFGHKYFTFRESSTTE